MISNGRYGWRLCGSTKAEALAAVNKSEYAGSRAHGTAFVIGYLAMISGAKRAKNCYRGTSFRSAWFDGWDAAASTNEIITFSTDLTVESKRRTKC